MATYKVKAYGREFTVEVIGQASGARILVDGHSFEVESAPSGADPRQGAASRAHTAPPKPAPAAVPAASRKAATGRGAVVAPIPGVITEVCVTEGEEVRAGQTVVKLEAMKMENDITALVAGVVKKIAVDKGTEVSDGQLLALVE
jgi:glutaconyl-CoA/methylmalonyl-CoA decarboxylase subunit gamma